MKLYEKLGLMGWACQSAGVGTIFDLITAILLEKSNS
jgi:hypothetical protein